MSKKVILILFCGGFAVGLVLGFLLPYIIPKRTIYDKLRDSDISFSEGVWYEGNLKTATYIQQVKNFETFRSIYFEKKNDLSSGEVIHIFVDPSFKVVWIQIEVTTTIEYIGFYFYTEAD